LVLSWLLIAVAAVAVPWAIYVRIDLGSLSDVFAPKQLWAALWPSLVGAILAVGLWRAQNLLPRVPTGDVLALADGVKPFAHALGRVMERIDSHLKEWPVAGVLFLFATAVLIATMLAGR
jgi:multicomponent Na+:H+ antiporter subunit A